MSNTKGVRKDRNICRIGCGRTGQRDYGWKGPAFNCCFGTVACLVEHKRPVGHASVARTCEYLPDHRNASLSLHLPYKPRSWPSYSLHFRLFQPHLGATGRHTHTYMYDHSTRKACWELFSKGGKVGSLPVLFTPFTAFAQVQSLEWCNDSFKEGDQKVSFDHALVSVSADESEWVAPMICYSGRNSQLHEQTYMRRTYSDD